jgi:hypothetical protein
MADPRYEVDAEGNLVEQGGTAAGEEQTVTPEEARKFLGLLALSEVSSVFVMALAAYFAFPGKPLLIVAATLVWAAISAGVWLYMRNNVRSRVKRPG